MSGAIGGPQQAKRGLRWNQVRHLVTRDSGTGEVVRHLQLRVGAKLQEWTTEMPAAISGKNASLITTETTQLVRTEAGAKTKNELMTKSESRRLRQAQHRMLSNLVSQNAEAQTTKVKATEDTQLSYVSNISVDDATKIRL